jgi:hypothetical protein
LEESTENLKKNIKTLERNKNILEQIEQVKNFFSLINKNKKVKFGYDQMGGFKGFPRKRENSPHF